MHRLLRRSSLSAHYPRAIKVLAWKIRREELEDLSPEEIAFQLDSKTHLVNQAIGFLVNRLPNYLDKPISVQNGEALTFSDTFGATDDLTEVFVQEFLGTLSDVERAIIHGSAMDYSQRVIGDSLGMKQMAVSRRLAVIREKYIDYQKRAYVT